MNVAVLLSGIALGAVAFLTIFVLSAYDPGFPGARLVPDLLLLPALMLIVFGGAMDSGAVALEHGARVREGDARRPGR